MFNLHHSYGTDTETGVTQTEPNRTKQKTHTQIRVYVCTGPDTDTDQRTSKKKKIRKINMKIKLYTKTDEAAIEQNTHTNKAKKRKSAHTTTFSNICWYGFSSACLLGWSYIDSIRGSASIHRGWNRPNEAYTHRALEKERTSELHCNCIVSDFSLTVSVRYTIESCVACALIMCVLGGCCCFFSLLMCFFYFCCLIRFERNSTCSV